MHTVFIRYPKIVIDRRDNTAWAYFVKERDGFACVLCKSTVDIESHHLERWVDVPRKRNLKQNGVTLCGKCHISVHNGKKEKPSFEKTYELICRLRDIYREIQNKYTGKGRQRKRNRIEEVVEYLNVLACDISAKTNCVDKKPYLIKRA